MQRVSKAQWLDTALEVLATDGIDGVRIEVLAKRLNTSKSGFYWHFQNRDDLLKDLLDHWTHELTEVITMNPEVRELDPKSRLIRISEMVHDFTLARYEMPIRQWAVRDKNAARAVRKVNQIRLDFAGKVFSELGFKGNELEMRTMLFVCNVSMEEPFYREISRKRRRALISRRVELLISK
jgi:AcrR family transcriptional regulator